jgi:hypothetical protein
LNLDYTDDADFLDSQDLVEAMNFRIKQSVKNPKKPSFLIRIILKIVVLSVQCFLQRLMRRCPRHQKCGKAGDGSLFVLLTDYEAIRFSDEAHIRKYAAKLRFGR